MGIEQYLPNAEAGNYASAGIVGAHYLFGIDGTEIDYAKALKWLSIAADQGAFRPISQLGYMYHHGYGVEKNIAEAVRLYKDSALRGNSGIAYKLGDMYATGEDVDFDPDEAIRWYVVSAYNHGYDPDAPMPEELAYVIYTPNIGEILVRILETDPESRVRCAAATMIGRMDITSAIPALLKIAEDAPVLVRVSVMEAFGFMPLCDEDENWISDIDRIEELLLRSMDDPDPAIRAAATDSIYQTRDCPETRTKLWAALDDQDELVQGHAVYALALMGETGLAPRLDQFLRSGSLVEEYFDAALELGDPSLLPAVLEAAGVWRKSMRKYETEYPGIQEAIDKLSAADGTTS